MSNCDRVVAVDTEKRLITVEGGCVVSKVLEALEPHSLTLAIFPPIKEYALSLSPPPPPSPSLPHSLSLFLSFSLLPFPTLLHLSLSPPLSLSLFLSPPPLD